MFECVACDSERAEERHGQRTVNVGSYELTLPDRFMHCLECNEDFHTGEQSRKFDLAVVEERRRREGLLAGADIRRIRHALGFSQIDLENALGIGPKTIARWETNLGVQSKAIDNCLRLIELDPDNLRFLVRIRQAARHSVLEAKLGPEDYVKRGELQAAIVDGLERANMPVSGDAVAVSEAIFSAINDHKMQKMSRLAEDTRVFA